MANCIDGAFMDIVSNCTTQPTSGLEIKGWIGNLNGASFTYDINNPSKVTNIELSYPNILYTIKGVKRLLNSGSSRLVRDNRADRFIQKINFEGFEFSVEASENLDKLSNVFVILVLRNKNISGNGVIRGYGLKYGINIDSDNWDANNNLSARAISLKSDDTSPEPHSVYSILKNDSYLETISMLENLEVLTPRTYLYNRGVNVYSFQIDTLDSYICTFEPDHIAISIPVLAGFHELKLITSIWPPFAVGQNMYFIYRNLIKNSGNINYIRVFPSGYAICNAVLNNPSTNLPETLIGSTNPWTVGISDNARCEITVGSFQADMSIEILEIYLQ